MKKYFLFSLLIAIVPNMVFGASARYTQLVREKQRKMEQLEKCMGSSKGLKIAGLSTIGLTAVGVAGNIAEAKIIKDNDATIIKNEKKIEKKQQEIAEKQKEIEENKAAEAAAKEAARKERFISAVARKDIEAIKSLGKIGDKAVTHGYQPEELSDSLRKEFADAIIGFIERCKSLESMQGNGIKQVALGTGSKTEQEWRTLGGTDIKSDDYELPDLTEHIFAECKIADNGCEQGYHIQGNACIPDQSDSSEYEQPQDDEDNTIINHDGNLNENSEGNIDGSEETEDCIQYVKDFGEGSASPEYTNVDKVTEAKYVDGICKITKCVDDFEPGADGKSCIKKTQVTTVEKPGQKNTVQNPKKKCNANALKALNASDGVIDGNNCKVVKCKGNLVKSPDNLSCQCPGDKPKYDAATFTCSANQTQTTQTQTTSVTQNTVNTPVTKIEPFNQSNYSGASVCSSTPGSYMGQAGDPDLTGTGDTKYCWCKLDTVNSPWVFAIANTDAAGCAKNCKTGCINGVVQNYSGFRDKITSKAETYNSQTVSIFKDVQVGNWDQCKALANIYMKQNALHLNFKDYYEKSYQYYLVYEDTNSKQYIFEFDDCDESWPSQYRHGVATALCKVYGGTPTMQGKGVECPGIQSADVNNDLASFNSNYSYGGFDVRRCGQQNTNCNTYSVTGFYW